MRTINNLLENQNFPLFLPFHFGAEGGFYLLSITIVAPKPYSLNEASCV